MTVNRIIIEDFGGIAHLDITLDEHIHLVETSCVEEMTVVLTRLLSVEPQLPVPALWRKDSTRITAAVSLADELYTVRIDADEKKCGLTLRASDSFGNDRTSDYCRNLTHCFEEDALTVFSGCDPEIKERLLRYMDEDTFYPQKSLSKRTDGCSDTSSFRLRLHRFIGAASRKAPDDEMQLRLFCHLKAIEFWDGFEDMRNLHYVRKPFIIKGCGEYFENRSRINFLFERAVASGRQVIAVLPVKMLDNDMSKGSA